LAQLTSGPMPAADVATAFTVFFVFVLILVWVLLGVVCWIFWRAKKREDAERKEHEWRNARSS
jgi:heme/copper-type cytochrome/quinol oxidase subunit 2